MRKLFGTDGIRGKVNKYPMTGDMAFKLGQAAALVFKNSHRTKVIIGKDTRRSGYLFEYALTSGLCSMGADVYLVGPMPTPAIAHLVRSFAADAGIVISASHNPAGDNGIKFFNKHGFKLPDDTELEMEKIIFDEKLRKPIDDIENVGRAFRIDDAGGRYIELAKGTIDNASLKGFRIVLDCANGAAYKVSPLLFRELGAEVIVRANKPDGLNINENTGERNPALLSKAVTENNADVGFALDGDADRVIMADEKGNIVDGDKLLAIIGMAMKSAGNLKNDTIVGTVMSNMAFEKYLSDNNIQLIRAAVGDRYVVEKIREHNCNLGGEPNGHVMLFDYNTTDDGTIGALQILKIMKQSKKKLSELADCYSQYPHVLINVMVKERKPIEDMANVMKAIDVAKSSLADRGRILVRYSGTSLKCRVMVEGKDQKEIEDCAKMIAKAVETEIGQ